MKMIKIIISISKLIKYHNNLYKILTLLQDLKELTEYLLKKKLIYKNKKRIIYLHKKRITQSIFPIKKSYYLNKDNLINAQ